MYNVMIVDDEPVIRFGLKASIEWEKEGLCLLGDFSNGEEAFEVMEKTDRVDLLITDIKMPVMDGLTLMKKALKQFPKLKVILVSSYNDFEYVREGLTYGAMDYVLKPTLEPEDFLQLIQKCVKKIEEERQIEEKLDLVDETYALQERKKLEQEMKRILLDKKGKMELEDTFASLKGPFLIICMKMKHAGKVEEEFGFLYKSLILEEIQSLFYKDQEDDVCFPINETEMGFFINKAVEPLTVVKVLKEKIEEETPIRFSFGYDVISDLNELEKGFQRSTAAWQRRFFQQNVDIFQYESPKRNQIKRLRTEQIKQFLLPYDEQKVMDFLQERTSQWSAQEMGPTDIKQEACDILTNLFMQNLDLSVLLDKCSEMKKTESLDELYEMLLYEIQECGQLMRQQLEKPYTDNELLDNALQYIHENYTQEVTLQNVADHIHISRNYFSILFKRFIDQNFIDYVIDLRIKKAKELLTHTSLKVYEVAAESGFKDVKYFSKLFKKVTGLSPGDFRTQHKK